MYLQNRLRNNFSTANNSLLHLYYIIQFPYSNNLPGPNALTHHFIFAVQSDIGLFYNKSATLKALRRQKVQFVLHSGYQFKVKNAKIAICTTHNAEHKNWWRRSKKCCLLLCNANEGKNYLRLKIRTECRP